MEIALDLNQVYATYDNDPLHISISTHPGATGITVRPTTSGTEYRLLPSSVRELVRALEYALEVQDSE